MGARLGPAPTGDEEVAIDQVLADKHNLTLGDRVTVADRSYRVVGITQARRIHDRVRVRHPPRGRDPAPRPRQDQRAILVGTADPTVIRARLAASGLAVVDPPALRRSVLEANTKVFGSPCG